MNETRAYTPQQVLESDFLDAIKKVDLYEQMDELRQRDPEWFNLLVNTFGPLAVSEYLSPGEKP